MRWLGLVLGLLPVPILALVGADFQTWRPYAIGLHVLGIIIFRSSFRRRPERAHVDVNELVKALERERADAGGRPLSDDR